MGTIWLRVHTNVTQVLAKALQEGFRALWEEVFGEKQKKLHH
jgi:hypothetical protein